MNANQNSNANNKQRNLIVGIIFDLIGMLSFSIPLLGEFSDVIWAPIAAIALSQMYKGNVGKIGGIFEFIEEILPFSDFPLIHSAKIIFRCLPWLYARFASDFDVLAHHEFLKTSSANIRDSLLRSDKLHALLSAYRSNFSWRAGKYVAKFHCKAIHSKVVQTPAEFVFELTPHNIEQLRGNFDKFAPYVEWVLLGASESLQVEPVFTWLYPLLARR